VPTRAGEVSTEGGEMSDTFKDECLQMLEDCEKRESQLTDWEVNFIDSLNDWMVKHGSLTEKQYMKLETVWEKLK
jgi:hypothetical protein